MLIPSLSSYLAFLLVAGLIMLSPGPDFTLVTRNAVLQGKRAALATSSGILCGLAAWTVASGAGLGAVIQASEPLFFAIKVVGAAYLVYLGALSLIELRRRPGGRSAGVQVRGVAGMAGSPFRQGLLSNLFNPKIAVLFGSLIPQFVTPGRDAWVQSAFLGATFLVLGVLWLVPYSLVASRARHLLQREGVRRAFAGVSGVVLIGLGARVALDRR